MTQRRSQENIELVSKFPKWFKYAVQSPPISCLKSIKKIRKNPKRLYMKNLESFANFKFIRFDKNIVKNIKKYIIIINTYYLLSTDTIDLLLYPNLDYNLNNF